MRITFTSRFVESLKGSRKRRSFHDDKVRGLTLRVTPNDQKSWSVSYRRKPDGLRRRFTIGPYPAFSLGQARIKAQEIVAAVAQGEDPAHRVQRRRTAITFADLVQAYTERFAAHNKAAAVLYDDSLKLKKDVMPAIGGKPIVDISKHDIIAVADQIVGRGAGVTANRVISLIKAIFNWGIAEDLVAVNPAATVRARVEERPRDRVLSDSDIRAFWFTLDDAAMTEAVATAMRLSLVTGQRIGQVIGIEKSELALDMPDPCWSTRGETAYGRRTKNREPNRVPLSQLALRLIRQAMALSNDSPFLFPSPQGNEPMRSKAATRAMTRSRKIFQIEHFTVHDLRRTCASGMARLGVPPDVISRVLDHVSLSKGTVTGFVYIKHSYDAEKRAALERWGEYLETLLADAGPVAARRHHLADHNGSRPNLAGDGKR